MRSPVVKAFSLGVVTGSFLTAGIVFGTTSAKADVTTDAMVDYATTYGPAICVVLDENHTVDALYQVGGAVMSDGFTAEQAVAIVGATIKTMCPRNWPLFVQAADAARSEIA